MIKIEHPRTYGWMSAVHGMRNPMNSWDKSDSYETHGDYGDQFFFGENDLALAKKLTPRCWWKEFDTCQVGTVGNSGATMHKIHDKEFTVDDFSFERTLPICSWFITSVLNVLNTSRERYLETKNKVYWDTMIQFLPSSYNQKRTVTLNYEVLLNMHRARKDHKLDEWRKFCDTVADLPYFKEVCIDA